MSPTELETTASLLARVRAGETGARDDLATRYLPALRRWTRGRLPRYARRLLDTDDLVQITLLRALDRVEGFEPRERGAFLAYMRRIVQNRIRDEIRAVGRRPVAETLDERVQDDAPSPLEEAIGREALDRYETALDALGDEQREAVVMRMEMGFTHAEVAGALGLPSANAARMMVSRALVKLTETMDAGRR